MSSSAIAFHLNNQQEIEIYLEQRQQQAKAIRKINESKFNSQAMRDRLLSRKSRKNYMKFLADENLDDNICLISPMKSN